jgi:hypothetical protein
MFRRLLVCGALIVSTAAVAPPRGTTPSLWEKTFGKVR